MNLRALIVDDSRVMRSMVMDTLRKTELAEFEFIEAGSGSEAMDKLEESIDIIFADWNMPGMNGIEFARYVRTTGWARHIPVIMITSESGDGKQQSAFDQARITCYITKPFTVDVMKEKLTPVLEELMKKREKPATNQSTTATQQGSGFFSKLLGG